VNDSHFGNGNVIVNAENSVIIEDLMIPERMQNLAGEPAHFCSGNELQDFFETGDGLHSSRLGALLEPFWIHVVGHFAGMLD